MVYIAFNDFLNRSCRCCETKGSLSIQGFWLTRFYSLDTHKWNHSFWNWSSKKKSSIAKSQRVPLSNCITSKHCRWCKILVRGKSSRFYLAELCIWPVKHQSAWLNLQTQSIFELLSVALCTAKDIDIGLLCSHRCALKVDRFFFYSRQFNMSMEKITIASLWSMHGAWSIGFSTRSAIVSASMWPI